jgi:hypothetical protein
MILAADDLPREKVPTPEWGKDLPPDERFVYVRTITAAEREAWESLVESGGAARSANHIRAALVVAATCDEQGGAMFTARDIPDLAKKSCPAVMRLFEAAQRLSRVAPADVDAMEKNSAASPSDSSATA